MVVGNGLIARGFSEYSADESIVLFASGVSNSANTERSAFDREKNLLGNMLEDHPEKKFIYFSTCSIYDKSLRHSPYVLHKLAMEKTIEATQNDFVIFRISNLAGNTDNPHTVLNFFIHHVLQGENFNIWTKASRNIIDISDALAICRYIINRDLFSKQTVNVANPLNYKVIDMVKTIEKYFGRKGNYILLDKESNPTIDIGPILPVIKTLAINFDIDYLERILKKYFPLHDL